MKRGQSHGQVAWMVSQVIAGLKGVNEDEMARVTIAYEPSWALGSGKVAATPSEANEGCYLIRQTIAALYNDQIANRIRVLYGGSVNETNLVDLMARSDIDGVLIGRASLDPTNFLKLVSIVSASEGGSDA